MLLQIKDRYVLNQITHSLSHSCLQCLAAMQVGRQSLNTSQVAHHAGAYPGFSSMKGLGVFLPPLDGMLVQCMVTPEHKIC